MIPQTMKYAREGFVQCQLNHPAHVLTGIAKLAVVASRVAALVMGSLSAAAFAFAFVAVPALAIAVAVGAGLAAHTFYHLGQNIEAREIKCIGQIGKTFDEDTPSTLLKAYFKGTVLSPLTKLF